MKGTKCFNNALGETDQILISFLGPTTLDHRVISVASFYALPKQMKESNIFNVNMLIGSVLVSTLI